MNLVNLLQEVSLGLALAGHLMLEDEEKGHEWAERNVLALRFPGVNTWAREKSLPAMLLCENPILLHRFDIDNLAAKGAQNLLYGWVLGGCLAGALLRAMLGFLG